MLKTREGRVDYVMYNDDVWTLFGTLLHCECYFVGHGNSDRRRSSSNSVDLYLDLDQLQRRHSSVCSDTDSVFSTGHTSMSSVDEDIVEQEHSALTATKRYTMAPLVRHDCISQL